MTLTYLDDEDDCYCVAKDEKDNCVNDEYDDIVNDDNENNNFAILFSD